MAPKSKGDRTEWHECLSCTFTISTKDVTKHGQQCCGASQNDVIKELMEKLDCDVCDNATVGLSEQAKILTMFLTTLHDLETKHGFIYKGKLFTINDEMKKAEEIKGRPLHLQRRTIYIHPSAMRLCKMKIGDPVLLLGRNTEEVLYAWPSYSLHPTLVSAYVVGSCKEIFAVQSFSCNSGSLAAQIQVGIPTFEDNLDWEAFSTQLVIQNRDAFVKQGNILQCNYFGKIMNVQVLSVQGRKLELLQSENVELGLQQLTLEDSLCPRPHPNNSIFYMITILTKVITKVMDTGIPLSQPSYDDIGGLTKQLDLIKETIMLSTSNSKEDYDLPRGILLFGPPGTGKTLILRAVCGSVDSHCSFLNGTDLLGRGNSELESKLELHFKEAANRIPSIVIIDEIEMLCSRRRTTETERRVMAKLINSISMLPKGVTILAATNKLEEVEPSLRKPGLFDLEVEIGVPNVEDKVQILERLLQKVKHSVSKEEIVQVSEKAHGYTGADLLSLVRQAGLLIARQKLKARGEEIMTAENLQESLKVVKPSAMKEVTLEIPKVYWEDIGGMVEVKKKLRQAVEWPLKHPEAFTRLGIAAPHGVLLYGPPGCSKTMIARALATESGLNFIAIKGPELFSKWVGESEQAIRELFRKARAASPCVLFFDEIDALAAERGSSSSGSNVGNRVLAQLLTELDGIEQLNFVTTVAATNRPDLIDNALLRPGRLDSILYVPLPDAQTRREIFHLKKRKMPFGEEVNIDYLVEKTEGYSGAEIMAVCQEAGLNALEESFTVQSIGLANFDYALKQVQPRTTAQMLKFYKDYSVQKIPG